MPLRLYNSLTKRKEEFQPINPDKVLMYTCGPTVYDYPTIGNYRTYTLGDLIYRALVFSGYNVRYIMNLTDVGHLTGDNEGDADAGEDRLEIAAEREGKSAKEIANYYIQDFTKGFEKFNFLKPAKFTRATEYIQEQIGLVKKLEEKGFTYKTSDGVYFDTSKFAEYGELSGLNAQNVLEGARVEVNAEKKSPTDFALWKFSNPVDMRWQEWDSPWGRGWPGWHLECSAMVLAELGESIDIHVGAEDLKMIHHQNEIAQSQCATDKKFVNFWMHGAFLLIDGGRMGKSLGNAYTISDVEDKGFSIMALRYFYMTAHYRTPLNFTWEALQNAQNSLKKMYDIIGDYHEDKNAELSVEHFERFKSEIDDDVNMPKAVAAMWELIKGEMSEESKVRTLLEMDKILGLNFDNYIGFEIPREILNMAKTRWQYRRSGIWDKADLLRREIAEMGYVIEDSPNDYRVKRKL